MTDAVTVAALHGEDCRNALDCPPCLYCGGVASEPLFDGIRDRLHYVDGAWSFSRCVECGSAMLCPQPQESELPSFYPPVYSFQRDFETPSLLRRLLNGLEYRLFFEPQYRAQVRCVARNIHAPRGTQPRLLDIGCGRGLRLLSFRAQGFQCVGMDFQPEVVAQVEKNLGIPAVCCDMQGLCGHFGEESFDVITAFFLIEHVPDVLEVLTTCRRLLKPGGWLVGAVPFLDSVQGSILRSRWINVTEAPRHLSLPTREGMRRVCARAGYDAVVIRPDSCLNCAGQVASSLLPEASITQAYGEPRWKAVLLRVLGGLVTIGVVPFVLAENYVFQRPATALVFARKPAG